jgi:hypothetical protein
MARFVGEIVLGDTEDFEDHTELVLECDGDTYLIFPDDMHEELERCVGHEVEIEGRIDRNERGDPVLHVRSFEILELMTEEDGEEYGDEEDFPEEEW